MACTSAPPPPPVPPLEAAALATPDRAYNLCEHIPKLPLLVLLAEPTPSLSVFSLSLSLLGLLLAAPLLIQALGYASESVRSLDSGWTQPERRARLNTNKSGRKTSLPN